MFCIFPNCTVNFITNLSSTAQTTTVPADIDTLDWDKFTEFLAVSWSKLAAVLSCKALFCLSNVLLLMLCSWFLINVLTHVVYCTVLTCIAHLQVVS